MNRTQLDAFAAHHALDAPTIARALTLTGSRPQAPEWRAFAANSLILAGATAVIAGLMFFVAANWQHFGLLARFGLLQVLLLACIGAAWWHAAGETPKAKQIFNLSLIGATFVTGTLLALFGQTYQTGADVYELFFGWAALAAPFALAAKTDSLWIIWACILNVGLALLCGFGGEASFGWRLFNNWGMDKTLVLLIPFAINGLAAAVCMRTNGWETPQYPAREPPSDRGNLQRFLVTFCLLYGTSAALSAITRYGRWMSDNLASGNAAQQFVVLTVLTLACAAVTWHSLKLKRDVYPLALVAAVFVVISSTLIVRLFGRRFEFDGIFLLGLWIIGTSTVAGILLMRYVRAWHSTSNVAVAPQQQL